MASEWRLFSPSKTIIAVISKDFAACDYCECASCVCIFRASSQQFPRVSIDPQKTLINGNDFSGAATYPYQGKKNVLRDPWSLSIHTTMVWREQAMLGCVWEAHRHRNRAEKKRKCLAESQGAEARTRVFPHRWFWSYGVLKVLKGVRTWKVDFPIVQSHGYRFPKGLESADLRSASCTSRVLRCDWYIQYGTSLSESADLQYTKYTRAIWGVLTWNLSRSGAREVL